MASQIDPNATPVSGSDPDAGQGSPSGAAHSPRHSRKRDWGRLPRMLPWLIPWLVVVVGGYGLSSLSPAPGLPRPIEWLLTPIETNPFRACGAEEAPVGAAPPASKASLFIRSALAGAVEAPADDKTQQQPNFEQQQQIPNAPPIQQQQEQTKTTSSYSEGAFAVAPAINCGEQGFGDLIDVALDQSGAMAWAINRYGLIYRSTNGGGSWQRQYLPDLPEGAFLSAIAVADAGDRLVVAARVAPSLFRFYRSDDGGDSWRPEESMAYDSAAANAGAFWPQEITGLSIGPRGDYVLALLIGTGPEVNPAVWRETTDRWQVGYESIDSEMLNGLRSHDFGAAAIDLNASGGSLPPVISWERWQGDQALRLMRLAPDPKDPSAGLTAANSPTIEYQIEARALRALAATKAGTDVFGAESSTILHGNARDEQWSRIELTSVIKSSDFALSAIDVSDDGRTIIAAGRNALFISQDGGESFFQPPLGRTPAPWFYFVLLAGPALALYVLRPGKPATQEVPGDETKGLSDRAIGLKDADALNLRSYAQGLCDLLRNAETRPPLVIGVTGPWGSGKSSLMEILTDLLRQHQMPTVWFNAWHHQSEEHLLASLLSNIRRQGIPGLWSRPGLRMRWRLLMGRLTPHEPAGDFLWSWVLLLGGIAAVSLALTLLALLGLDLWPGLQQYAATELGKGVQSLQQTFCGSDRSCGEVVDGLADLVPSAETIAVIVAVLGLFPLHKLRQVALLTRSFDPGKLMTNMMPASRNPKLDEQLSFRHRFGEELSATVAALAPYRLVIFIDDLDRCKPQNVTAILEAVNFVVTSADCYVVLGMDRAYVLRAIRQEFEKFIATEQAERKAGLIASPDEDKGRPRDFAEHYLEKLINLFVAVPKMSPEARAQLMAEMAARPTLEQGDTAFDWRAQAIRGLAVAAVLGAILLPIYQLLSLPVPQAVLVEASDVATLAQGAPSQGPAGSSNVIVATPQITPAEASPSEAAPLSRAAGFISIGAIVVIGLATLIVAVWRAILVPVDLLIKDSKAFQNTLKEVEGRLGDSLTTPRRAKRFVNRLRLFASVLRSTRRTAPSIDAAELDRDTVVAGALHALGRELLVLKQGTAGGSVDQDKERLASLQKSIKQAMWSLYELATNKERIVSLWWRFWEFIDGASEGDSEIAKMMPPARSPDPAVELQARSPVASGAAAQ